MTATALLRVLVILSLLALPSAAAAGLKGELEATGPIGLAGVGPVSAPLIAAYGRSTDDGLLFEGVAASGRVDVYEARSMRAGASAMLPPARTRNDITDTAFTIHGARPGYVAATPVDATLVHIEGEASLAAETRSVFGGTTVGTRPGPQNPFFARTIDEPHFLVGAGTPTIGPLFLLKIYGPTLALATGEGSHEVTTGYFPDPLDPSGLTGLERWAVLRVEGTLRAAPEARVAVAVAAASFSLDGRLAATCLRGSLTTGDGTLHSIAGRVALEGHFVGRAQPGAIPTLTFEGEARSARVADRPLDLATVSVSRPDSGLHALPFVVALVLAGAAVTAHRAYRKRASQPTAETCLAEAALAIEAADWTRALHWIGVGRAIAPSSARLAIEQAFVLERRGDVDEAFAAYEEASVLGDDGLAEFHAARLAASTHQPGRRVAAWIARALRRDASLADDLREDGVLDPYTTDPDVRAALRGSAGA